VVMPPGRSAAQARKNAAPAEPPAPPSPSFVQALLHFVGVS
jgi:hypothetical protein